MSFTKEGMKNLSKVYGGTGEKSKTVRLQCEACQRVSNISCPVREEKDKTGDLLNVTCPLCGHIMRVSPNVFE